MVSLEARGALPSLRAGVGGASSHAARRADGLGALTVALEARLSAWVGPAFNPLVHSGALATLSFAIALLSGVYVFLFYDVTAPYESVARLSDNLPGLLMRGLHRYASRAFLLFAVLHAVRLALIGHYRGPRWLAWHSGVFKVLVAWFVGITGYLLVWDQQAYVLTLGLVRLLDSLLIFVQPFALTFLSAETLRDNIFFITLFLHLSVPALAAVLLWLHVSRTSRPRLLPTLRLGLVATAAMSALALLWPALSAPPADLARLPHNAPLDPWYSLGTLAALSLPPLAFGLAGLAAVLVLLALPWLGRARPAGAAVIDQERCNGCVLCSLDCPYGAITMVPAPPSPAPGRRRVREVACVNPARCVGCSVCLGSCTAGGISLGELSLGTMKERVSAVLRGAPEGTLLVLTCRQPGPLLLPPGMRHFAVPCVGSINRNLVGHALAAGAAGVLVVACPVDLCRYREGATWTWLRAARQRRPSWLPQTAERAAVTEAVPGDAAAIVAESERFRTALAEHRGLAVSRRALPPLARAAAGLVLATGLLAAISFEVPVYASAPQYGMLKVAVRTEAPLREERTLSAGEQAGRLEHMRRPDLVVSRERLPLALIVEIDGQTALREVLLPRGFRQDGPTFGYTEVHLAPGEHRLTIRLASPQRDEAFAKEWDGTLTVVAGSVHVVSYGVLGEGFVVR